mmetsp:Transcript_13336/g.14752  ORF Transcript_13336/g.14752 Transcript_13336/m.14752 type:complete len:311 (+) Transcript_13336:60-992(+)
MARKIAFGILLGLLVLQVTTRVTPVLLWSDAPEFASGKHEIVEHVGVSEVTEIVKALVNHNQNSYLAESGTKPDAIVVFGFEELETPEFIKLTHEYGETSTEEETYFFDNLRQITEKESQTSLIFPYVKSFTLTRLVSKLRSIARHNFYEVNLFPDGKDKILRLIDQGSVVAENETQIIYIGLGSIVKLLQGSFVDQQGFFELVDLVKGKFSHPIFMMSGSSYKPQPKNVKPTDRHVALSNMNMRMLETEDTDTDDSTNVDGSALNGTTVTGLSVFAFFLIVVGIIVSMLLNTQTPITYTKIPLLKGKEG